jgi:hypothetical protein
MTEGVTGRARASADDTAARRTLVVLTVLRQGSSGLVLTLWLLTAAARGLSPAQIGLVVAVSAFGTAALELPTGALADVVGRRVVLVAAALGTVAGALALAVATTPAGFYVAAALLALTGALASGPLEAWFVDRVGAQEDAVRRGLAAAGSATGFALAAGGLLGAGLAQLGGALGLPGEGTDGLVALSVPFLVAVLVAVVEVVLLLVLLRPAPDEVGAAASASGLAQALLHDLPRTVASGSRLAVTDPVLRWFALRWLLVPVGFLALELLSPLRLADLLADPADAATVMGALAAGCFVGVGVGATAAGPLASRVGALGGAALTTVAAGAGFAVAGAGGVAVLAGGVLVGFVVSGPGNPLLAPLVHERVDGARRATVLSARSLVANVAVGVGAVSLGAVGSAVGTGWAFAVAGAVTVASALPLLGVAAARSSSRR